MKHPSSIFSFDSFQVNLPALATTKSIWICAVLLLLFELTIRVLVPDSINSKGGYHSSELRQQVKNYQHTDNTDLLIVGSSIAAVNFSSKVLGTELHQLGLENVSTYNGGIRGCNYACIDAGVKRYYLRNSLPHAIIAVINPADVNQSNTAVISRSVKFIDSFKRSDLMITMFDTLSDISHAIGYRSEVQYFLTNRRWPFDPTKVNEHGDMDMGSQPLQRYDDPINVSSTGSLSEAFLNLIRHATSNGLRVFVLPTYGDSLARKGFKENDRIEFNKLLAEAGSINNVEILELKPDYAPDTAYIDNIHLNSDASALSARTLAQILYPAITAARNQSSSKRYF